MNRSNILATHHLDDTQPHAFWDNTLRAALTIAPGDTVVFETLEASAGQITPKSTNADMAAISFDPIHPLTGPVFVDGAQPGDTLEVEILDLQHKGWGWNARHCQLWAAAGGLHRGLPAPLPD